MTGARGGAGGGAAGAARRADRGRRRCGFWPRPQSLRGRFTIANVAFLAVGLLLAAVASIAATYMVLVGEIDDSLKSSQADLAHVSLTGEGLRQLCTLADLLGSKAGLVGREGVPAGPVHRAGPARPARAGVPQRRPRRSAPSSAASPPRCPTPATLARGGAHTVRTGSMEYRVVAQRLPDGTHRRQGHAAERGAAARSASC